MGIEYVTRGARLICVSSSNMQCGSHMRRLNIKFDKRVTIRTEDGYMHPLAFEDDCEVGEGNNIPCMGICAQLTSEHYKKKVDGKTSEEDEKLVVTLIGQNENGVSDKCYGSVAGIKCTPDIDGEKWQNTKETAFWTEEDNEDGSSGKSMVCMTSFLRCKHGGIIIPVTNGLEYCGTLDSIESEIVMPTPNAPIPSTEEMQEYLHKIEEKRKQMEEEQKKQEEEEKRKAEEEAKQREAEFKPGPTEAPEPQDPEEKIMPLGTYKGNNIDSEIMKNYRLETKKEIERIKRHLKIDKKRKLERNDEDENNSK